MNFKIIEILIICLAVGIGALSLFVIFFGGGLSPFNQVTITVLAVVHMVLFAIK